MNRHVEPLVGGKTPVVKAKESPSVPRVTTPPATSSVGLGYHIDVCGSRSPLIPGAAGAWNPIRAPVLSQGGLATQVDLSGRADAPGGGIRGQVSIAQRPGSLPGLVHKASPAQVDVNGGDTWVGCQPGIEIGGEGVADATGDLHLRSVPQGP
jgi:hypothetical protein